MKHRKLARVASSMIVAALLVTAAAVSSPAAPSVKQTKRDLKQAQSKLDALTQRFSAVVEQYDQAQAQLQITQQHLTATRQAAQTAADQAARAKSEADQQIAAAYETPPGSQLDFILGASSLTDLSDRIEYMNQLTAMWGQRASDATLAREKAAAAAQDLADAKAAEVKAVQTLNDRKAQVEQVVQQEKKTVSKLQTKYHTALKAQRKAERLAKRAAQNAYSGYVGSSGGFVPSSSGAAGAVQAAMSRIGDPYVWAAAGPNAFDCSGLTMWAWAQVGVGMPHSAAMQYAAFPHVSYSDLQPGDLLFFYSPISHVGMYIGGGRMVAADNPATGVHIDVLAGYWNSVMVGAARPS